MAVLSRNWADASTCTLQTMLLNTLVQFIILSYLIYFQTPVQLKAGDVVRLHMWRRVTRKEVWYEWTVSSPYPLPIHNPKGRSYTIGLQSCGGMCATHVITLNTQLLHVHMPAYACICISWHIRSCDRSKVMTNELESTS